MELFDYNIFFLVGTILLILDPLSAMECSKKCDENKKCVFVGETEEMECVCKTGFKEVMVDGQSTCEGESTITLIDTCTYRERLNVQDHLIFNVVCN